MTATLKPITPPKIKKQKSPGRKLGKVAHEWTWFAEYKDFLHGKIIPVSEAFIEQLAKDYTAWAIDDNTALIMTQFPLLKRIPPETFLDWCHQHQTLGQAHRIALTAVGNRRELGGLARKLDSSIVSFTMPTYNKGWKDLQEWRASIKDINVTNEQKVIVIEKISLPPEEPLAPKALSDKKHKTPEEVARHASMKNPQEI